jgi:hypothetical protein
MAISDLIGSSPKFRAVLDEIKMVAPVDCAVMVRGETGTGKEVVAQAIHEASPRRQNRFVALNCAAIPAALLESELAPSPRPRDAFKLRIAARCFWMKSETFLLNCNQNFSAFSRSRSSNVWGAGAPCKSMCVWLLPPIRICGPWCRSESFAPIFITG